MTKANIIKEGLIMRRGLFISISILLCVVFCSANAFGGGYGVHHLGAKETALGPMFNAMASDSSANWFNPAGMTQLPGTQVYIGAALLVPQFTAETAGNPDNQTSHQAFLVPHAYLTRQMSDRLWLGFGVNSPFGQGVDWDHNWPGRYNVIKANVYTVNFNPNAAWKINDKLSVAAGLDVLYLSAVFQQNVALGPPFGDMYSKVDGDGWAVGYNFAVHYKPVDWMSLGASYRSGMNVDLNGNTTFNQPPLFSTLTGNAFFNNVDINGRFKLPQQVYLGVAAKAVKTVTVGIGANWYGWSSHEGLTINNETPVNTPLGTVTANTIRRDWKDSWRIGGGVEWNATEYMDLRLGLLRELNPVPQSTVDYTVPVNDAWEIKAGVGFHKNAWSVDVGYTYTMFQDYSTLANPSTGVLAGRIKDSSAQNVVVSFGYKF